MKLLLFVALLVVIAQIVPSCDSEGKEIVGWVEEKYVDKSGPGLQYVIVINHVQYEVLFGFWNKVEIGDLVKYDGTQWTILKKRS